MEITGYYNEHGYQVDAILYRAGNHALDSQQDATGTEHQLPLEAIKEFCEQTSKEIAEEHNAKFVGIEYLGQDEI